MRHLFHRSILLALAIGATSGASATPFTLADPQRGSGALPPRQTVVAPPRPMAMGALALPQAVDLTPWAAPVGDQGQTNSCVSWTVAHAMLGWYRRRAGFQESFAPMYMHSQINQSGAFGGDLWGAFLNDAMNVVLSQGNEVRSLYWTDESDVLTQPTLAHRDSAKRFKYENLKYTRLFAFSSGVGTPDNVHAIKQALANGQPVAIGLFPRDGFYGLKPQSPVDNDTTTYARAGHAVLALGYNDQGLLIQNSWGTGWGSAGFGRLSWNKVQKDVYEAVVVDGSNGRPVCSIGANTRRLPASGGTLTATAYCAGNPTAYKWKIDGADAGTGPSISATLGANPGFTRAWNVSVEATNAFGSSEVFFTQLGQQGMR
jgi:hypothetical protein